MSVVGLGGLLYDGQTYAGSGRALLRVGAAIEALKDALAVLHRMSEPRLRTESKSSELLSRTVMPMGVSAEEYLAALSRYCVRIILSNSRSPCRGVLLSSMDNSIGWPLRVADSSATTSLTSLETTTGSVCRVTLDGLELCGLE